MAIIYVYLNVLLYGSNAYLYFFVSRMTTIKPLYFFIVSIVSGLFLFVLRHGFRLPQPRLARLIYWSVAFAASSALSFVLVSGAGADTMQALIYVVEGVSILVVFALLLTDPRLAKHAAYAVFLVTTLAVCVNYIEFFHLSPWEFSIVGGRAAGLYMNPNITGHILVFGMIISATVLPKQLRFLFCVFVLSGTVLTFSRAAMMLWCLAVVLLTWFKAFMLPRALSFSVAGGVIVVAGVLLVSGRMLGLLDAVGLGGYLDENTTARMSGSFIGQGDFSTKGRMMVAEKGLQMFFESPLIGKGIGAGLSKTDGLEAHNMYIQIAAEQGLIGLLILLSLIWVIWRGRSDACKIFALVFAGFCVFSHKMLDQPENYVLIATVVAGAGISMPVQAARKLRSAVFPQKISRVA